MIELDDFPINVSGELDCRLDVLEIFSQELQTRNWIYEGKSVPLKYSEKEDDKYLIISAELDFGKWKQ